MNTANKPLSINDLTAMKRRGEKITCLTAYDASFASVIDKVGIDILLIGDSLGMVVQGHSSTVPVTIEQMVYHSQCVSRARQRAFIVADMPFMTYTNLEKAAANATQLLQAGGAQMVKLEGAKIDCVHFLVECGIPVCGHLGLLPQSIHQIGAYSVQGKLPEEAQKIRDDAEQLQQAGASLLVLECVPASLARQISQELTMPVIGIGAGMDCDGQVLVLYDLLDIGISKRPKFSKNFMIGNNGIEAAIKAYHHAVKNSEFPGTEHSF